MSRPVNAFAHLQELERFGYDRDESIVPLDSQPSGDYLIGVAREKDLPVRCIRVAQMQDGKWHTFICELASYGQNFSSAPHLSSIHL
jgi:hypothetical protein